jgi:hypothetical protein
MEKSPSLWKTEHMLRRHYPQIIVRDENNARAFFTPLEDEKKRGMKGI